MGSQFSTDYEHSSCLTKLIVSAKMRDKCQYYRYSFFGASHGMYV